MSTTAATAPDMAHATPRARRRRRLLAVSASPGGRRHREPDLAFVEFIKRWQEVSELDDGRVGIATRPGGRNVGNHDNPLVGMNVSVGTSYAVDRAP
jgi:hypothetical protein